MTQRSLDELVEKSDPAWPNLQKFFATAKNQMEVLPVDRDRAATVLHSLQVTTRSALGAIAYETGGILIDQGWIRLLGSGHPRLSRDLWNWNQGGKRFPGTLLVADDAVGGFFAINGGALQGPQGNVFYLAPDNLRWEDLGRGFADFLAFLAMAPLEKFYENSRWPGWPADLAVLDGDHAFSIYPFLCAKEGGSVGERSRAPVPIEELWTLHEIDLPRQLGLR